MKKIILGILIGLFIGGLYWQGQYIKLHNRYMQAVKLVRLLK
ncbi:MAG: hypothetical protein WC346_04305 [Methanogenium sp.]|jgi:hypothetical protein